MNAFAAVLNIFAALAVTLAGFPIIAVPVLGVAFGFLVLEEMK